MTSKCCKKTPRIALCVLITVVVVIGVSLLATLAAFSSDADDAGSASSSLLRSSSNKTSTSEHGFDHHPLSRTGDDGTPAADERVIDDPNVEYVKPKRVLPPPQSGPDDLLDLDLLSGLSTVSDNASDHGTGHFRPKSTRTWDPSPRYEIDAFGQHMLIVLEQIDGFLHKNFSVTHVTANQTLRKKSDHEEHGRLRNCFYKGRVEGDSNSVVTVSLCRGMTGHIQTSHGTFEIQPFEDLVDENLSIVHEIRRALPRKHDDMPKQPHDKYSHCDVGESDELKSMNAIHHNQPHESEAEGAETFTTDEPAIRRRRSINGHHQRNYYHYNSQHSSSQYSHSGNSHSNEYTIEVLVAVDKKMQEKHGDKLQEYVLTLMSTVSSIYADASIGHSFNVAVVHILVLKEDLVVPKAKDGRGVSASAMLLEFCEYNRRFNFHHDTAILITREQICRSANNTNCDTLGLAELGTMCKPKSCAIVQDNGLSAAFTIAHELGHVLNMPHDDDKRCVPFRSSTTEKQNIMSRMLDANTNPWSWSSCSRHFVTEYLENNQGHCLLNKPQHDLMDTPESAKLAGEKFTDNQQCELAVGPGSKICSYMPVCSRLWCTQSEHGEADGCATQHMPWADGTACGDGKWCQKGECVHRTRSPIQPIDGNWSEWSEYGPCSRTCGGGIAWSERHCDSPKPAHGGRNCPGSWQRYLSCNTQECPENEPDFRERQCNEVSGSSGKLVPKYVETDECKLFCKAPHNKHYIEHKKRVIDGTPCNEESFDKCILGKCEKAGCDNVLGSSAELDRCGICEGRNETCREFNGYLRYDEVYPTEENQYHHVVKIPKGAANIEIRQVGYINDHNFISLLDDKNRRILNKPNEISDRANVKTSYAGVSFLYSGAETQTEVLRSVINRRLKRDMVVELFVARPMRKIDENIVTYSFSMSTTERNYHHVHHELQQRHMQQHHQQAIPHYHWKLSEWGECDQVCSGKRRRSANCYELNSGQVVAANMASKYCSRSVKPQDEYEPCNVECKLEWEVASSGECSEVCGEGVRTLRSVCIRRDVRTGNSEVIDSGYCPAMKSSSYEKCYGPCLNATYEYGEWGPCSVTCGGGSQLRSATCLSHPNGKQVEETFCLRQSKTTTRACNEDSCPEWIPGEPGPCSVTCGEGSIVTRSECRFMNRTVEESLCSGQPTPVAFITACSMPKCPATSTKIPLHRYEGHSYSHGQNASPRTSLQRTRIYTNSISDSDNIMYAWSTSSWGECSIECGFNGTKVRSVWCHAKSYKDLIVEDWHCDEKKRPVNTAKCTNFRCPEWDMKLWSECDDNCMKHRQVFCLDHRGKISDRCPESLKPPETEPCDCHIKWGSQWKPCSASCGSGVRVRDIVCMKLFKKSLTNPHPRRNAKILDDSYCAHHKKPHPHIMERPCKSKRNCSFRWFTTPWSKCSSGCGSGYAYRDVYCSNGTHKDYGQCDVKEKPKKSRVCENKSQCRWRTGKWKHCTCSGFTKRRVVCVDQQTNNPTNNCPDELRPPHKQRCTPPPNCSCRTLQQTGVRRDGEQMLSIRGREVSIYCYNMTTPKPLEFLTLKSGTTENYSIYYSKRAREDQQCGDRRGEWHDPNNIFYGTTRFHKIRIDVHTLRVTEDDFTFADTVGSRPQPFGSAGDCYSSSMKCPQGDFSINLTGTRFRIRPRTMWDVSGRNSEINYVIKLDQPYQRVRARCGGYCGECRPSHNTSLYLELIS